METMVIPRKKISSILMKKYRKYSKILLVESENNTIELKPIAEDDIYSLSDAMSREAKKQGFTPEDLNRIIKKVRRQTKK